MSMHNTLIACLENRMGDIMKICDENKDYILAAAIHPFFRLTWIDNESEKEFVQTLLINACIERSITINNDIQTDDHPATDSSTKDKSDEKSFLKHLRTKGNSRRNSNDDTLTLNIYKYLLRDPVDVSQKEFQGSSLLEDMFRRYNTTLSSIKSQTAILKWRYSYIKTVSLFCPNKKT